jgi:hypothetical protein
MKNMNRDFVKTVRCVYCKSGAIDREYSTAALNIPEGYSSDMQGKLDKLATHKNRVGNTEQAY